MVRIIGLSKLPTMVFQVAAIIGYRDKLSEIYDIKEVDCCNCQKFKSLRRRYTHFPVGTNGFAKG